MKKFIDRRRQARIAKLGLCPLPALLAPLERGKILVFAPHPDDETLGCGGTLALLRQNGCAVKVVFVTDGGGAGGLPDGSVAIRRKEAAAALNVLGVDDMAFLDEPDGSFHNTPKFEEYVFELFRQFRPDWIFLPSVLDYHRDHVAIAQAVLGCWQRWDDISRAFFYEIWSPLPATWVVDIGSVADLKRAAISRYELPLAHCDYLTACMGLASYRGLYLPGATRPKYAEAFVEAGKREAWGGISKIMLNLRICLEGLVK